MLCAFWGPKKPATVAVATVPWPHTAIQIQTAEGQYVIEFNADEALRIGYELAKAAQGPRDPSDGVAEWERIGAPALDGAKSITPARDYMTAVMDPEPKVDTPAG